jgi:GTPase SAR1 family protein
MISWKSFWESLTPSALLPLVAGVAFTLLASLISTLFARRRLPEAYSVAVIGLPRSGKTSLITAMFGAMFSRKLLGYSVRPRGESTIERVNEDLERLELGRSVGPTTDQDLFAYRADIVRKASFPLFSRTYKVEIGDFPGEDSERFAIEFGDWIHRTPYFKWAMEADAFILVVDIARVIEPIVGTEYTARISKAIRAAWQRLEENHLEGKRALQSKRVVLVFTKADLFGLLRGGQVLDDLSYRVARLGFGDKLPPPEEIDLQRLSEGRELIVGKFKDLLKFFASRSKKFEVVFVSVCAFENDKRLGIEELTRAILPG